MKKDPGGSSVSPVYVVSDFLNLLFLHNFFSIIPCVVDIKV